jgi:hypothetical protein
MDSIILAQHTTDWWRALVASGSINFGKFLISWATGGYSRRIPFFPMLGECSLMLQGTVPTFKETAGYIIRCHDR